MDDGTPLAQTVKNGELFNQLDDEASDFFLEIDGYDFFWVRYWYRYMGHSWTDCRCRYFL